ncbi:exonuclease subunit SbcD [Ferrimonas gelatinilytica]|uniref:Nuclease SbcCD subunit D n=1 Tax=Ferrimonas gelatinilytica TaxID=1255257 RepID=A0ABP9S709_9GAMM
MRIIHTSDWHLGQHFYGKSRLDEHRAFLDWLLEQIQHHQADALIVAGDLFDTGTPPSYARSLYNDFVVRLHQTDCQLVLLGGNHDSVAMLEESKVLLSCLGTHLVARAEMDPAQQVVVIKDPKGKPLGLVCAIPYLRPRDLAHSEAGHSAEQKKQALQALIGEHYQGVYRHACQLREELAQQGAGPLPIVATGHLTCVGASQSESVRDLYIGTLDAFPASAFPPVDYLALGHIHRPQRIAGSDHLRYSGSPIPLSFDELGKEKEVLLVELDHTGFVSATPLPVPTTQPMAMLKGDLASLEQQLAQWPDNSSPADAQAAPGLTTWLDIEVTDQAYLSDLQNRILALTEGKAVEVLLVRRARTTEARALEGEERETLTELTVEEVFHRRLALESLDEAQSNALRQRFADTLAQLDESEEAQA